MALSAAAVAKAAAMLLTNEKTRKGIGWILVAILSPLILIAVVLCSMGTGTADHNNHAVKASFYGASYSDEIPVDYRVHVDDMRTAFFFWIRRWHLSTVWQPTVSAWTRSGSRPFFMLSALGKMPRHAEQPIGSWNASIRRKPGHALSR